MKNHSLLRSGLLAVCLALLAPVSAIAQTSTEIANTLLNSYVLPGTVSSVKWTNLSNANPGQVPVSGSGTITATPPGGPLTYGFYSFTSDFTAVTSIAPVAFDIQSAVFQMVGMRVSGQGYDLSIAEHLAFNGGPVLTYSLTGGGTGTLSSTFSGSIGDSIAGTGGPLPGDYYNFSWQWDLSSIVGNVISVSVTTPVHIHQSVIGAQLNVSDTFGGNAIPEPSTYAAIAGAIILAGACMRRGKR